MIDEIGTYTSFIISEHFFSEQKYVAIWVIRFPAVDFANIYQTCLVAMLFIIKMIS